MSYLNKWIYKDKEFNPKQSDLKSIYGFVYLLTNKIDNRKYIGMKSFWQKRKQKSTGRRKTSESNWKMYYGSSDTVKETVIEIGAENFRREILYICQGKKECTYREQKEQWNNDVLLKEEYYNTNIAGKFFATETVKWFTKEFQIKGDIK